MRNRLSKTEDSGEETLAKTTWVARGGRGVGSDEGSLSRQPAERQQRARSSRLPISIKVRSQL